jgi:hypothetical protein
MARYFISCPLLLVGLVSGMASNSASQEAKSEPKVAKERRGLLSPIRQSFDASLVCRIGPHRLTVGEKYTVSETLKLPFWFDLQLVSSEVYRVAFFHRRLDRMVVLDSGHKMSRGNRLGPNDFSPLPPKPTGTAGEWKRTGELVASEPGIFTINVTWMIARKTDDGDAWVENVESGPVLLIVEPTDHWRKKPATAPDEEGQTDLFKVGSQQGHLEFLYPDGEHKP